VPVAAKKQTSGAAAANPDTIVHRTENALVRIRKAPLVIREPTLMELRRQSVALNALWRMSISGSMLELTP
jgi:hypothetical protein